MSTVDSTCLLFVQMTAKPDQEEAFNTWYEQEYIPAFVRDIPGIVRGRRFETLSPDAGSVRSYITLYEFENEAALHRGLEVMKSREEWRKSWKDWEGKAVSSISDGLFKTTVHVPGAAA